MGQVDCLEAPEVSFPSTADTGLLAACPQPMTILMTRVLMSPSFTAPLAAAATAQADGVALASAFAVVVASNTAANFSVMGALAGIMFCNILAQRGMTGLSYLRFSKLMVPAGVASTLMALVVLGAEFVTWGV